MKLRRRWANRERSTSGRRFAIPTAITWPMRTGRDLFSEPGVLAPPDWRAPARVAALGVLPADVRSCSMDAVSFPTGTKVEKTLVLIKPDRFPFPKCASRRRSIFFSGRTGSTSSRARSPFY